MGTFRKMLPEEPTSMESNASHPGDTASDQENGELPSLPEEADEPIPWKFVPIEVITRLVHKLNPPMPMTGSNWKALAGALGYSTENIWFIESLPGICAENLLTSYGKENGASLNRVVAALRRIGRRDCVDILHEAMSDILACMRNQANNPPMHHMAMSTMFVPLGSNQDSGYAVSLPMASLCSLGNNNGAINMASPGHSINGLSVNFGNGASMGQCWVGCPKPPQQERTDCGHWSRDTSLPQNISPMDNCSNINSNLSSLNTAVNYSNLNHHAYRGCHNFSHGQAVGGIVSSCHSCGSNLTPCSSTRQTVRRHQPDSGHHPHCHLSGEKRQKQGSGELTNQPHSSCHSCGSSPPPYSSTHPPLVCIGASGAGFDPQGGSNNWPPSQRAANVSPGPANTLCQCENLGVNSYGSNVDNGGTQSTSLQHLKKMAAMPDKYKPTSDYKTIVAEQIHPEEGKKMIKVTSKMGNKMGKVNHTSSISSSSSNSSTSQTFPLRVKSRHQEAVRQGACAAIVSGEELGNLSLSKKSTSMPQNMKPPPYRKAWRGIKVFVTYSMDNQNHNDSVLCFGYFLQNNGFTCYLDQPVARDMTQVIWQEHTERVHTKFYQSDFVVVCLSPKYLQEVSTVTSTPAKNGTELPSNFNQSRLHTREICQFMMREYLNRESFSEHGSHLKAKNGGGAQDKTGRPHGPQVVPVLFGDIKEDQIPRWLRDIGVPCKRWEQDFKDIAWLLTRPQDRIRPQRSNNRSDDGL